MSCFFSPSHKLLLLLLSSLTAPPPATLTTTRASSSHCLSRSFSFTEQIKLKLLFSSSQVSSSTPAPPVVASVPTIAAPLFLSFYPPSVLARISSQRHNRHLLQSMLPGLLWLTAATANIPPMEMEEMKKVNPEDQRVVTNLQQVYELMIYLF